MPNRQDRSKKKVFRRTPGGKTVEARKRGRPGKHSCANCGKTLSGVPHNKTKAQVARLPKTKKRPSAIFGGVLCGKCRTGIMETAVLVRNESKKLEDVELNKRKYVEQAIKRIQ